MAWKKIDYAQARPLMRPGDIIAFSGDHKTSQIIEWATRSNVSHVGIILQTKLLIDGDPQQGLFNQVIESANINGFKGVSVSRLSERIEGYRGEIWWLPLSPAFRKKLDLKKFYDFLIHQVKKPYDLPQAIRSALDKTDHIPWLKYLSFNQEDFSAFFCSELCVAGLQQGGAIQKINASEVTPIDLCRFKIYATDYYQLKGAPQRISRFNTISPEGFGCKA